MHPLVPLFLRRTIRECQFGDVRVSFGDGAPKCIGVHFARMWFSLTFREVTGKYRIELAKDGNFPAKLQHFPFTRPLDGLPVRLLARGEL